MMCCFIVSPISSRGSKQHEGFLRIRAGRIPELMVQHDRHFFQIFDFACAKRMQNQRFEKNVLVV